VKTGRAEKSTSGPYSRCLTQAAFSYIGTEIVAIAAGETKNPRRNLPRAIKRVYVRILLFYICGVLVIGLLVPSNYPGLGLSSKNAAGSPFVIAIKRSGIKALPSIINACLLSECSSLYLTFMFERSLLLHTVLHSTQPLPGRRPALICTRVLGPSTVWLSRSEVSVVGAHIPVQENNRL
jgi:amino acid permease